MAGSVLDKLPLVRAHTKRVSRWQSRLVKLAQKAHFSASRMQLRLIHRALCDHGADGTRLLNTSILLGMPRPHLWILHEGLTEIAHATKLMVSRTELPPFHPPVSDLERDVNESVASSEVDEMFRKAKLGVQFGD